MFFTLWRMIFFCRKQQITKKMTLAGFSQRGSHILLLIRNLIGSQYRDCKFGVIWSYFLALVRTLAAAFCTICSLFIEIWFSFTHDCLLHSDWTFWDHQLCGMKVLVLVIICRAVQKIFERFADSQTMQMSSWIQAEVLCTRPRLIAIQSCGYGQRLSAVGS